MLRNLPNQSIVDIWRVDLMRYATQVTDYHWLLSEDESKRAEGFYFERDRACYIITRGVLRLLLSNYLSLDPKEIIFQYNQNGKPYLANGECYFNVSHTKEYALIAVSKQEVGVDIEAMAGSRDIIDIAKRFFTAQEAKQLLNKSSEAFYYLWSAKEAYCKLHGQGIYQHIGDISLNSPKELAENMYLFKGDYTPYSWRLIESWPGYIAGVAVHDSVKKLQTFDWQGKVHLL